jgi:hypothetical protein
MPITGFVRIPGRNHLVGRIISRRTYRPRSCDNCSGTYYRCNKFEAWIQQNVGHITGWRKVLMRICIKCQDAPRSMKSLLVVEAHIGRALHSINGHQERRRA